MPAIGYLEKRPPLDLSFPVEYYRVQPGHPRYEMPYHWHMEHEIIRVLEGELSLTLNEEKICCRAGGILFIPGGCLHGGSPSESCVYECAVYDPAMLIHHGAPCRDTLKGVVGGRCRGTAQPDSDAVRGSVELLFHGLRAAFDPESAAPTEQDALAGQMMAVGGLYAFYAAMIGEGQICGLTDGEEPEKRHIGRLKRSLAVISEKYAEPLTLEELSRAAGLAPKYFCRFFFEMTGKTPIDYLNYYRCEQAAAMLAEGTRTLADIAYACGFHDVSYFIKIFKKNKGVTPGLYRARIL